MPPKPGKGIPPKVKKEARETIANDPMKVPDAYDNGQGFLRLRNGIWTHIREGRLSANEFVVYCTLYQFVDKRTGICRTTAASLASNWGDGNVSKELVQQCLARLREKKYINYPQGTGLRGAYPVLIDKFDVNSGLARGWRLNAQISRDFSNPLYEYMSGTPYGEAYGALAVDRAVRVAVEDTVTGAVRYTVRLPLLEVKRLRGEEVKSVDGEREESMYAYTDSPTNDNDKKYPCAVCGELHRTKHFIHSEDCTSGEYYQSPEETEIQFLDESKLFDVEDDDDDLD